MLQSIFIIARRILRDAIRNRLLLIGLVFTLIISGFAAMACGEYVNTRDSWLTLVSVQPAFLNNDWYRRW